MDSKKEKTIIFRFEANDKFGTGHLIRCINLFSFFSPDWSCLFLLKELPNQNSILLYLDQNKIKYELVPSKFNYTTEIKFLQDLFSKRNCVMFITDLVHGGIINSQDILFDYHARIKQCFPTIRILSIEDSRMNAFSSDTAIIPNIPCRLECEKVEGKTKILKGYKYLIFNKSFKKNYKKSKVIKSIGENIVVCIGGSDPNNVTLAVVKSLLKLKIKFKSKIICGPAMNVQSLLSIKDLCNNNSSLQFCEFSDEYTDFLQWADLCIVGEGMVKFDSAVFGVPSVLITQFDHSSEPVQSFIQSGCCAYAGPAYELNEEKLAARIYEILLNEEIRKKMSDIAAKLIDLDGGKRIVEQEIQPNL